VTAAAFGRYEVRGEIGDGSMGRVYRGFDPRFGRPVAIKTIKSEYLTRDTRDEYLRRFRREAPAAGRLSHPNIVSVYDVGEDYLVMELVEGVTLSALLKERRLAVGEALELLSPLADALDCAHRAGVVHRDLKPVNIMVQPDGRPKLMDFGIAHLDTSLITVPGHFFGSPSYMAPELLRGEEATSRADLFSFATVAYEVLTNHKPFEGDSVGAIMYKVVHEPLLSPRRWRPDLPEAYDAVFGRALAKAPERRFPCAREFVAALRGEGAVESGSLPGYVKRAGPANTETLPLKAGPPRASRRAWFIGGAALLVAGAVVTRVQMLGNDRARGAAASATLRIETTPPGATVWLDGLVVGRSPLELRNLRAGPRHLRILEDGYAPAEVGLELGEGTTDLPLRFAMSPTAARLTVRSEPDGATVRVDGRTIGTTPLDQALLGPGRHEVRVERQGFRAQTRRIEAGAGQPLLVALRLEPLVEPGPAEPAVKPRPLVEGALVAMDGTVTPPNRIEGRPAPYPKKARKLKLKGSVLVETIVTAKGEPTEIQVLESAGTLLDEAVVEAIRGWRFEPARKGGVKVSVRWRYQQTFER
jgi:TonB family protein